MQEHGEHKEALIGILCKAREATKAVDFLELGQLRVMGGHVRVEDAVDDDFAQALKLCLLEVLDNVAALLQENLKGDVGVVVLKHTLVVVDEGELGP